jgi:hypothetical protein
LRIASSSANSVSANSYKTLFGVVGGFGCFTGFVAVVLSGTIVAVVISVLPYFRFGWIMMAINLPASSLPALLSVAALHPIHLGGAGGQQN